jgi:hypothetical protein
VKRRPGQGEMDGGGWSEGGETRHNKPHEKAGRAERKEEKQEKRVEERDAADEAAAGPYGAGGRGAGGEVPRGEAVAVGTVRGRDPNPARKTPIWLGTFDSVEAGAHPRGG